MPEKLKYHERVNELKVTIVQVADALDLAVKNFANMRPDGVKSLMMEQVDYMRNRVALIVPGRARLSPEERHRNKAVKAHERRLDRTVGWLRRDGMVVGAYGLRAADQAPCRFLSIPTRTLEGIKVRVELLDDEGNVLRQLDVDALAYRPDFSFPTPPPTTTARPAPKTVPAKKQRARSKGSASPKTPRSAATSS